MNNFHSGKGHKPRTVGLDPTAFALIDRWRAVKAEHGLDLQTTPLFCTLRGGAIASGSQIRDMLKRRAAKAGIDKRVHPHGLRRAHASELIAEGVPTNALQKQLGHADLATTAIYVDHLGAGEDVKFYSGTIRFAMNGKFFEIFKAMQYVVGSVLCAPGVVFTQRQCFNEAAALSRRIRTPRRAS